MMGAQVNRRALGMHQPMSQLESIRGAMVGSFYSRFSVGDSFEFYFSDFVLSSQDVLSAEEEIVNSTFVDSYPPKQHTIDPDRIAKSTVLATCLRIQVVSVDLLKDSSLEVTFRNGIVIRLPTDTPIVDWHWATTESGGDPYSGCHVACFAPGDVQGCMPNSSFKSTPLRGAT
jgi:hypothetical protein